MPNVNITSLEKRITELQALKEVKAPIGSNVVSKGETEKEVQEAKERLLSIDRTIDTLIESTITLLTQTKTLFETYDQDYVHKFSQE